MAEVSLATPTTGAEPIAEHGHSSTGISNTKLAMWLFLGSECLLFGGLISTYLLYKNRITEGDIGPRDVFDIEYANYAQYQANGVLAPIDVQNPDAYKQSLLEAYATDGTQYALPSSFSDVVLYYNKDLFDAAGLDYPSADWTWADEKAAGQVTLKDLDLGARLAAEIETREEWRAQPAQATVARGDLVAEVKAMLARIEGRAGGGLR